MTEELKYYFSVFLRRIHYFLLVSIVISVAGISVAMMLPTTYRSTAVLLIESPQIPEALAASTVQANPQEQLQIMEQRLLSRANLLEIANEVGVYDNAERRPFPDQIVSNMRSSTKFEVSRGGRNSAPIFTIGFTGDQPQKTAQVVNAYVTRILEDNAELRRDRAGNTLEFFEAEVERLSVDLARKSAEILEFKNANLGALPENLEYQLERQSGLRDRQAAIARELASLDQQRERLILISRATGAAGGRDLRTPQQRELDALNNQLSQALTTFSEQNPRIRVLRNQIASLETQVAQQASANSDGEEERATVLDLELSQIDSRVEALEDERKGILEEIEVLQKNIEATPANSIALEGLNRDYANLQGQYNSNLKSLQAAAAGERIEDRSQGERITVLSPPVPPRQPLSPNRPLIAAGSVGFGMFAGLALVVLLELLNRSIRRPVDLVRGLGITPLATLPMIRTPGEIARRRGIVFTFILAASIGMVGLIYVVHTEVMALDLLADRAMSKIGL